MCKYPPSDRRGPHHWASAELHRTFCQGQINAASRESTSSDALDTTPRIHSPRNQGLRYGKRVGWTRWDDVSTTRKDTRFTQVEAL